MKKIVYLTESDLYRISKRIIQEEKIEIEEGIFDGISNIYQGLKGVWRGEGYDFFRYLNTLKNIFIVLFFILSWLYIYIYKKISYLDRIY